MDKKLKALRQAKKEEKKHVPTREEIAQEDKEFVKEARGLGRLLSPAFWFRKKK
jgi:hypothetical protein